MALLKIRLGNLFVQKNKDEQGILGLLNNISDDIRSFTHAIAPLKLKEQTLADAIEDLIYSVENQTGLTIQLEINGFGEQALRDNQKHTLFQTLQELLNNTMKHASATEVLVKLFAEQNTVSLSYKDNGQGFDVSQVKTGIGLRNI